MKTRPAVTFSSDVDSVAIYLFDLPICLRFVVGQLSCTCSIGLYFEVFLLSLWERVGERACARQASHPPLTPPKGRGKKPDQRTKSSILLTIRVCFVSYAGRFGTIPLFIVCPAFSSLNL